MKTTSISVVLILVISMMAAVDLSFDVVPKVSGITITVDDSGGADYLTIQEAVDAANWYDTVYVYSGTYVEQIVIDIPIDIVGESNDTTIIDGNVGPYNMAVVKINQDEISLTGFKIKCNHNYNGIELVNVQNCIVSNNIVIENNDGIHLISSNNNEIKNNFISNNNYGIYLENSDSNSITGNNLYSNHWDGIHLVSSNENTITSNIATENMYNHIYLEYSNDNIINTNILEIHCYGIHLIKSTGNTISGNTMTNNGIFIDGNQIEYWNTHNIGTSNTLNSKPIYYLKNQNGGSIPTGVGQVILANCTDITVSDQDFGDDGIVGIELGFSSHNNLINITMMYRSFGIIFEHSNDNMLLDYNNVPGDYAIQFSASINNNIINSSFIYNLGLELNDNSHATVINMHNWEVSFGDVLSSLTVKWYLHVNVTNNMGIPVPSTNVKIEDNQYGSYNETFTTNNNGYLRWLPLTEYIEQKSGKTYVTPYQIKAWNDTLVGYAYPDPVMDQSKYVNITLYNGTILDLEPGWNLISFPRYQSNPDIQTVLQSMEGRYDSFQWYNVSDSEDSWKHYQISKPSSMNDLNDLDNSMGFWINIIDPQGATLIVSGDKPISNQTIQLYPGWNLVGYPSLTNYNRTVGLNNLAFGTEVDTIQWFNTTTKTWHDMETSDSFVVGQGYWIHATSDCTWEVPL